jgi:hypothetical protein
MGRFYMEGTLLRGGDPIDKLDWLGSSERLSENYEAAFNWTVACIKAQKGWPLLAPAQITVRYGAAGIEYELEMALEDFLGNDRYPRRHPRDLSLATPEES